MPIRETCSLRSVHPDQQMSEYAACAVKSAVDAALNPNICVFGSGFDSSMWAAMAEDANGHAYIFEHEPKWIKVTDKQLEPFAGFASVHQVGYDSKHDVMSTQYTPIPKPAPLPNNSCDVAVVDSPQGFIYGRGQSLQEAVRLTKAGGTIFLDDANRSGCIDDAIKSSSSARYIVTFDK